MRVVETEPCEVFDDAQPFARPVRGGIENAKRLSRGIGHGGTFSRRTTAVVVRDASRRIKLELSSSLPSVGRAGEGG